MSPIITGYVSAVVYGLLCIALGVFLYKLGVPKKYTRKTVHILVGFEWAILYHFFGATIHTLIVCLAFTALLIVSYFAKAFPAMSSDSDNAPGTVYYGVSMSIMAVMRDLSTMYRWRGFANASKASTGRLNMNR